jgi:Glycosyl transferase family 2
MPRLKDVVANHYLEMMARRVAEPTHSYVDDADAAATNGVDEIRRLMVLLKDQNELILRLKETDAQRSVLHQKLKTQWRIKKEEGAALSRRNKAYKRLLRHRRHIIRDLSQRLRVATRTIHSFYKTPGMPPPVDASPAAPGKIADSLIGKALRWLPSLHAPLWNHWMRLGVLKQFEARPVQLDAIPSPILPWDQLPKISMVTPSYNQARYLDETMRSILDQRYPNLEYIVMDGGSNDGSVDIIKRHAQQLAHWQSARDEGQAAAVREGLAMASGDIMAWLNSDDLLLPGTLAYVADYFSRNPKVDVVYGHRIVINESSHEVARWVLPRHDPELLLWADFIPQETCFWRRSIYEKIGGMDGSFQFALDWDLLLRFQKAGARMVRLPYFLGGFRIHCEQKNAVTISTAGYKEMGLLRRRELGDEFNRGGLAKRVNQAQFKALISTFLLRFGVRW